ncbi:hypothetical protein [Paenibacillus sp. FSL R7-0331]|uniref:hypothetical protein n=1 Tax=Paenibacillus sp. FSL R7-0331 TaxID=1536773 RepID=UPI0004F5B710|nr:hypothetical protein [Paenibacillus sp. FSL R7-0331]AIQ52728.1 hypothetical protein R70331_15205 [Paenibacillus sp. FSL R7-0331]
MDATKSGNEVGHHIAQNTFNKKIGISRDRGPAVLMSKTDHAKTRTFAGKGNKSMRDDTLLASVLDREWKKCMVRKKKFWTKV